MLISGGTGAKSPLFAVLVICLDVVEEIIVGLIPGKSFSASIPQLGGGGLEGVILVGVIISVVLIPLFLLTEVQKAIGKERLRSFIFHEQSKSMRRKGRICPSGSTDLNRG
jgi:hypothetical protein